MINNEICDLIPSFKREIDWGRGKSQESKDKVRYVFKNGSVLDNLAARESTRGQRRHGGLMEECVGIDVEIFAEHFRRQLDVAELFGVVFDDGENRVEDFHLRLAEKVFGLDDGLRLAHFVVGREFARLHLLDGFRRFRRLRRRGIFVHGCPPV